MALQFLLEGQEEIGSPNLAELLQENARLLKADIALSADGGQISPEHVRWHPCIPAPALDVPSGQLQRRWQKTSASQPWLLD